VPSTEDTQVNDESMADEQEEYEDDEEDHHGEGDDQQSEASEGSADEAVDTNVQIDMEKLQDSFPGFRHKYRLIKRIGEGTASSPPMTMTVLATRLTLEHPPRHILNCLQSRRLTVRPLRQHMGRGEGERKVVDAAPNIPADLV